MANVLGLSFFYHDSAAVLVRDGRAVAAAAEERFYRRKHTSEFPKRAIEYCLDVGSLRTINDLDAIVFYEKPVMKLHRIIESLTAVWPRGLPAFARQVPSILAAKINALRQVERA
jgi:carbamoyltransferase